MSTTRYPEFEAAIDAALAPLDSVMGPRRRRRHSARMIATLGSARRFAGTRKQCADRTPAPRSSAPLTAGRAGAGQGRTHTAIRRASAERERPFPQAARAGDRA